MGIGSGLPMYWIGAQCGEHYCEDTGRWGNGWELQMQILNDKTWLISVGVGRTEASGLLQTGKQAMAPQAILLAAPSLSPGEDQAGIVVAIKDIYNLPFTQHLQMANLQLRQPFCFGLQNLTFGLLASHPWKLFFLINPKWYHEHFLHTLLYNCCTPVQFCKIFWGIPYIIKKW